MKKVKTVAAVAEAGKEALKTVAANAPKATEEVAKATQEVAKAVEKTAKAVAGKAEEVKQEAAKAPAKRAARKSSVKETVYLQYLGKEIDKDDLMAQVKTIWTKQMKNKVGDMKSVTLYLKPEENKAYYVINEEVTGSIEL